MVKVNHQYHGLLAHIARCGSHRSIDPTGRPSRWYVKSESVRRGVCPKLAGGKELNPSGPVRGVDLAMILPPAWRVGHYRVFYSGDDNVVQVLCPFLSSTFALYTVELAAMTQFIQSKSSTNSKQISYASCHPPNQNRSIEIIQYPVKGNAGKQSIQGISRIPGKDVPRHGSKRVHVTRSRLLHRCLGHCS